MMISIKFCFLLLTIGASWAFKPIIINAGETGRYDTDPACATAFHYGCQNISTAHDCGIVKNCISSVWNNFNLPEDNDDICQICKEMVKEARDQLLSNETQEEIKEVFDGSCNLIPIKIIAEECCKVADQFIPELVETLASEMNPQMVCATAGLCNSRRIDSMLKELEAKKLRSDCDICMGYAKDLQRYVQKTPKSILLEKALVACGHLNSFSTGCREKVIDNFFAIQKYLQKNLKKVNEGCAFIGFCQQNEPTYTLGKNEEDPTCEFCEKMVQHWIDALTSGTTEEEFKQILEAVCDRMGNYKDECNILVDDYFEDLYNLLVNQVKPAEVCQMFGLCEKKNVHHKANVWALIPPGSEEKVKMILADEAVGQDESAAINKNKLPSVKLEKSEFAELTPATLPRVPLMKSNKVAALPMLNAQNAPLPLQRFSLNSIAYDATKTSCVLCEYVMHEIQNMLTKESTEEEIKKSLDEVCSIMPDSIAEECEQFVNQYTDLVVALLVQEIDPAQVCTYLQLCPGKMTKKLGKTPDAECELCEFVIHLLDEYLEDDATEETIRDTLDEVCGYMPKSVVKQCQEFVNEYEPMIVEALAAALTPDETCVELDMCKPKSVSDDEMHHESPTMTEWKKGQVEQVQVVQGLVMESPGCVMCEFAMTQIASMLNDNSTDEEIIETVENACKYLPKTVEKDCEAFIETYGHAVIDVLKDETKNPKEACSIIGLCDRAKKRGTPDVVPLKLNRCEGCEMVVSYLDRILKEDKTEEHIDEALQKVCNIVPPSYAKQCKKIVHVYGDYLNGLMEELKNEHEVCAAIHLCLKEKQLLGGDKCTWGPSYWCISPFHAKSCKATTHCKEKVWKKQ